MNNLIQIKGTIIGSENVNSVNAREVYEYLGVKTRFNDWIKRTIEKYDFEENTDYTLLTQKRVGNNATLIEYIVTIDMAKELCMITDTHKGKEVRRYFIQREKEFVNQQSQQLTPAQILMQQAQFMIEQEKFNQNIAKEIKEVKQIAIEAKINAEEYPKEGFESIHRLAKIIGLSNNVVKKIIKIVNPKTTQARKKLPDGSLKPYTAYKIKPIAKFAKKLKRSAVPVGKKSVVFQSPLVPFRFQLI